MKRILIILAVLMLLPYSLKAGEYQDEITGLIQSDSDFPGFVLSGSPETGWMLELYDDRIYGGHKYHGSSVEDVFEKACDEWIGKDSASVNRWLTADWVDSVAMGINYDKMLVDTILRDTVFRPDLDSMIDAALVYDTVWYDIKKPKNDSGRWDDYYLDINIRQSLQNIIEVLREMKARE